MKKVLKWVGILLALLIIVVLGAGFFMFSKGKSARSATYEVNASLLSETPSDSLSLARGMHLSRIHGCQECHGETFTGKVMIDAPPFRVVTANLTTGNGGIGGTYTTEDWDRAIRYGVKPDGSALLIMPSKTLHNLSDEDTASLIAYMKTVPPVDSDLPPTEFRTLGTLLAGLGEIDLAGEVHTAVSRKPMPGPEASPEEQGAYLTSIVCIYCHGEDLRGGEPLDPSMPPPPDLAAASSWSFDQFSTTMRTGMTPTGKQMETGNMPWESFKHMTDDELEAIHAYMKASISY